MSVTTPPAKAPATQERVTRPAGNRLGWLDALRGIAAAIVVFEHTLDVLLPEIRDATESWFDFGRYGVYVFFIVSGNIIPASLERRGSVRRFWIGRIFRLYPAWAVAVVFALVIGYSGMGWEPEDGLAERPWFSALAHLTMLQDLLGTPGVLVVLWTLSYEMVFYLLVTALFVAGAHRASAHIALGFALLAVPVTVLLAPAMLTARSWDGMILATALLMAAGLLAVMSGHPAARTCGVALLGLLGLGLLTLNSRVGGLESFSILATMFAGTAIYRLERGELRGRLTVAMVAAVPLLVVAGGLAEAYARGNGKWSWPTAVAAAWATFAIGMALRHRRFPGFLVWLGVISYSVYLLHQPLVQVIWRFTDPGDFTKPERLMMMAGLLASILLVGWLCYRLVELPMQGVGRRVTSLRGAWRARAYARPGGRRG